MKAGMSTFPAVIPIPMTAVPRNSPKVPRIEQQITPARIVSRPGTTLSPALRLLPRSPMTMENAANISTRMVVTVPMTPENSPDPTVSHRPRRPMHVNDALRQIAVTTKSTARPAALEDTLNRNRPPA